MVSRRFIAGAVASVAASSALMLTGAGAAQATSAATWHTAIAAPGLAALDAKGNPGVGQIKCPSAGNCSAGGEYEDSSKHFQAFVISEVNGVWHNAIEVPGLAALNAGENAHTDAMACASAGNCVGGGVYTDARGVAQAFLVNEVNGVWHNAFEVPGFAALNHAGKDAGVGPISCPRAGDCSAGGIYEKSLNIDLAFVVDEVNGVWHNAVEVPGLAHLSTSYSAPSDLSCPTAGNCVAVGSYGNATTAAFAASEVNGVWHQAIALPANKAWSYVGLDAVRCPTAGNCSASGGYQDSSGKSHVIVASEVNGAWHQMTALPGLASLQTGPFVSGGIDSCFSDGNCVASGDFPASTSPHGLFWVASQVNGTWHAAVQMPGAVSLSSNASLQAGSCASANNCSFIALDEVGTSLTPDVFVIDEVNGVWQRPSKLPGLDALSAGGGSLPESIDCTATGYCGTIGWYNVNSTGHTQVFVANES